jgi:DNA-binding NarL/FixJ family response regulator
MTTSEAQAIGVLVVDDDPLVRAGLAMMLGGAPDIRVVAEAGDGTQVPPLVDRHRPDVVLMDIRMPNMDGPAATEALRARRHAPEVIILTTFDADEHVLRAGAAGFVPKDTPPAEIGAVLFLSVPTVKTHVSSILTKLDLNNRVQIALLAHDAGLLDEE